MKLCGTFTSPRCTLWPTRHHAQSLSFPFNDVRCLATVGRLLLFGGWVVVITLAFSPLFEIRSLRQNIYSLKGQILPLIYNTIEIISLAITPTALHPFHQPDCKRARSERDRRSDSCSFFPPSCLMSEKFNFPLSVSLTGITCSLVQN